MLIDLAFRGGEVKKSPKGRFSQQVTLKFFDSRQIDIELSNNSDVGFFPFTLGKFKRSFASLTGFDGVISFAPHGKAFIDITESEYRGLCGQVFIVPLRFEPAQHKDAGSFDGRPYPASDSQIVHLLDPDSFEDTGVVGKYSLESAFNEVDSDIYRCEVFFSTKRNKYGSPVISLQVRSVGDLVDLPVIAATA